MSGEHDIETAQDWGGTAPGLCQRCHERKRVWHERYCRICRDAVLRMIHAHQRRMVVPPTFERMRHLAGNGKTDAYGRTWAMRLAEGVAATVGD